MSSSGGRWLFMRMRLVCLWSGFKVGFRMGTRMGDTDL
jgi:hypothetical protein